MRSNEANRTPLFRVPPFPSFPNASRYVPVGSLRDAVTRVVRSVDAHEGLSLVIGPPGTGKSLLVQLLAQHFATSRQVVQVGDTALVSPEAFLRSVLHSLNVNLADVPSGDLHLALVDFVRRHCTNAEGLLILVDESQSLDDKVLDAIRMATNIMRDGQPSVSAVLCGGPKLDETLALPSLESLVQRVATRCYLHPMNHDETKQFVHESISRCGAKPCETIADDALSSVHHAAVGVPRLINQLMTQAIDSAEEMGQTLISSHVVDCAWATLQQLPSPMIEEPSMASPVEFGALTDSDDETEQKWQQDTQDIVTGDDVECEIESETTEKSCAPARDAGFDIANTSSIVAGSILELEPTSGSVFESCQEQPSDELVARLVDTTPLASDLFGEFEAEEDVAVGPVSDGSDRDVESCNELEESLRREVNAMANEVRTVRSSQDDTNLEDGASDVITNDDFVDYDETIELRLAPESGRSASRTTGMPALDIDEIDAKGDSVMWLDDDESSPACHDDSDLLIIEDDVDVDGTLAGPVGIVGRDRDSKSETVAVDFQAMLAKMRGGV